eukprot:scaffold74777_cov18-Tisochrysis_lutea.AAC.6
MSDETGQQFCHAVKVGQGPLRQAAQVAQGKKRKKRKDCACQVWLRAVRKGPLAKLARASPKRLNGLA